jgi:enoyl-CoA hydratase/carnithine racemase
MAEARKLAEQLVRSAPIAMRYIINAVNKGAEMPFAEACSVRADALRPGGVDRRHARGDDRLSCETEAEFKGR